MNDSTNGIFLPTPAYDMSEIELDWLTDKYTAVEVKGTVKVGGKEVDVSRRVYQIEVDKNYVPNNRTHLESRMED